MTEVVTKKHPLSEDMATFLRKPSEMLPGLKRFYEAGVTEALHSALYICSGAGASPDWVLEGAYEVVSQYLMGKTFKRSRTISGERRKLSKIKADFIRWAVVVKMTEAGLSLNEAYDAAVDDLQKHGTHLVSSSAVRAAYKRVSKELKSEQTS